MKISKKRFDRSFKYHRLPHIIDRYGFDDKPAIREAYHNTKDLFFRMGLITEKQADNWVIPDRVEFNYPQRCKWFTYPNILD